MKNILVAMAGMASLLGCAAPETVVMQPYELANGHVYQDVVSVGANGKGTAPTVTVVNTYLVGWETAGSKPGSKKFKECHNCHPPVSTAVGTQQGAWNIFLAGLGIGSITVGPGNDINVSQSQDQTQGQNQ